MNIATYRPPILEVDITLDGVPLTVEYTADREIESRNLLIDVERVIIGGVDATEIVCSDVRRVAAIEHRIEAKLRSNTHPNVSGE